MNDRVFRLFFLLFCQNKYSYALYEAENTVISKYQGIVEFTTHKEIIK